MKYMGMGSSILKQPLVITVNPDGSDAWRLEPAADLLKQGGVGIIPTDSLPALVCDLENREAVLKLYYIRELHPKKPLSILCRNFRDVSQYTLGFPANNLPGQPDMFSLVRRVLPGPYTFILLANKNLPAQIVDFLKGTAKHRKSVGVRIPADPLCQAVLENVGGVLACTSVHVPDHLAEDTEVPDTGTMLELYESRGIDFIVDVGRRVATASSVVDLTGTEPVIVRAGAGDVSLFENV